MYDEDQLETIALTESGLTPEEQNDVRAIAQLVYEEPDAVDEALRSVGVTPDPDDEQKVLQLVKASLGTNDFDARMEEQMNMRGFSFKGLGKKIGSIFKKGGGKKIGYALAGIFKGKKKKLAEAIAKKSAGEALTKRDMKALAKAGIAEPVTPDPDAGSTQVRLGEVTSAIRAKYTKEEIKFAKDNKKPGETLLKALKRIKQMKLIKMIGTYLGIILAVVLLIWGIRVAMKRMGKKAA